MVTQKTVAKRFHGLTRLHHEKKIGSWLAVMYSERSISGECEAWWLVVVVGVWGEGGVGWVRGGGTEGWGGGVPGVCSGREC